MDSCYAPGLIPPDIALQQQLLSITAIDKTEEVTIEDALYRVVADDISAPFSVPMVDNSAMDGYAFSGHGVTAGSQLTIVGKALAGHPFEGDVKPGECIRIMTGADLPPSCDTVLMQEKVTLDADQVVVNADITLGQSVRKEGEDVTAGSIVVAKGTRLLPAHLSLLASLGIAQLVAYKTPIVGLMATGDELVEPGNVLASGQIYESNRTGLKALLAKMNVQVIDYGIIKDDQQSIAEIFTKASQECDWLISSGGVSVGDADYVKDVLDQNGKVDFWKVAIKPGKPYAFGKLGDCYFSGLPGNPVSSFVTFEQFVVPGLRKLSGANFNARPIFKAQLQSNFKRRPGREEYLRAFVENNEQGDAEVAILPGQGSAVMQTYSKANCFIKVPAQVASMAIGDIVEVQPFFEYLQ